MSEEHLCYRVILATQTAPILVEGETLEVGTRQAVAYVVATSVLEVWKVLTEHPDSTEAVRDLARHGDPQVLREPLDTTEPLVKVRIGAMRGKQTFCLVRNGHLDEDLRALYAGTPWADFVEEGIYEVVCPIDMSKPGIY